MYCKTDKSTDSPFGDITGTDATSNVWRNIIPFASSGSFCFIFVILHVQIRKDISLLYSLVRDAGNILDNIELPRKKYPLNLNKFGE